MLEQLLLGLSEGMGLSSRAGYADKKDFWELWVRDERSVRETDLALCQGTR